MSSPKYSVCVCVFVVTEIYSPLSEIRNIFTSPDWATAQSGEVKIGTLLIVCTYVCARARVCMCMYVYRIWGGGGGLGVNL